MTHNPGTAFTPHPSCSIASRLTNARPVVYRGPAFFRKARKKFGAPCRWTRSGVKGKNGQEVHGSTIGLSCTRGHQSSALNKPGIRMTKSYSHVRSEHRLAGCGK